MSAFKTILLPPLKRFRGLLIVAALVALALIVWSWAGEDSEKISYISAPVVRGDIENLVTATGRLQPREYVDVGAQVSGQLQVLHVEVGSEVKEGDLLAEIDATVYLAKVDATRAQLRNQRAQLVDNRAQLKLAEINFKRQKNLQKEDATTQESVELAEASLLSAQAQIEALQAQIEQIESSLRAEEANLEFARIYAPMAGTVVSITARQGQTLNTNQSAPTLMQIADLSTMTVQAQVSEADIGKLKREMSVYFTTLGGEGRRWYSKLDRIEPTPTVLNNVVLYNALFDVPNPNRQLMTQMTTQVFFITAQARNTLLIPMSALNFKPRVARAEGKPQENRNHNSASAEQVSSGKSTQANDPSGKNHDKVLLSNDKESTGDRNPDSDRISDKSSDKNKDRNREQRANRASVKVINANGEIEERAVTVGVTNRVQAEILSGLTEGETVITGIQQNNAPPNTSGGAPGRMRMR